MDRQDYLDQISGANFPVKKSKFSTIVSSKFFIVGAIGVVGLILLFVIGNLINGGKMSEKEKLESLILHIQNTSELIKEYQPNVKSSELRSYSSSFASVLSNTNTDLVAYTTFDIEKVKEKIIEEAQTAVDGLNAELFDAKINGILDRIYAHKMAYEISIIVNDETQISKSAKDETLKQVLDKSQRSLETLYSKFNDFSAK